MRVKELLKLTVPVKREHGGRKTARFIVKANKSSNAFKGSGKIRKILISSINTARANMNK